MTHIPAGHYVAALHHTQAGLHACVVTCGFKYDGSNINAAAPGIGNSWVAQVLPQLADELKLDSVTLYADGGAIGAWLYTATGASANAPASPPQVAAVIQKRTAQPGRKGRGRLYLPGIPNDHVQPSGGLTTQKINALTTAFASWKTDCTGLSLYPCILHNDPLLPPYLINEFLVNAKVGTQKRRLIDS